MFRYSLRRITRMILYTSSFSWLLLSSRVACMADFHPSTSPSPVPIFHIITRSQTWPVHVGMRVSCFRSSSLLFPCQIRPQNFARYALFFSSHHAPVSVRYPLYVISFGSIRHSRCPSDVIHPGIIVACHVASSSRLTVSVFPVASL